MSSNIITNDNFSRYTQRRQWADDNRHICYLPYTSRQFFHSSEYISPCCNLVKTTETDYLKPIIELKQAIKSKKTYDNCAVCYKCEDEGKISERTRYLIELSDTQLDNFLANQEVSGFHIHCTLSNLCNMACRSCNIHTSSLFAKIEIDKELKTQTISDDPSYWNAMLGTIKYEVSKRENIILVISGGEGFVQPDFKKLLTWCIDENLAKRIHLTINTNGIIDNEKFIEFLCNNFLRVSLAVSVDSIYENYHYVRWPGTWDKILRNLETFVLYKNVKQNFHFFLTPVWSINNIFYLKDWIIFFEEFTTKHSIDIPAYDTPLFQPEWLDTQHLPVYIKEILIKDLEDILSNVWFQKNVTFHANIKNLIELYRTSPLNITAWNTYLRKTAQWDIKTHTKLEQQNKKLFDNLNNEDKDKYFNFLKLHPF